jgi:beta-glucosidase-like glycosyl hydrolase
MKTAKKLFAAIMALAMILCMLPATVVASSEQEHKDLAREAVGEGIVLLKNNDALPLTSDNTIAVFGGGQVYTASTSNGYQSACGGSAGSKWITLPRPHRLLRKAALTADQIYEPLTDGMLTTYHTSPTARCTTRSRFGRHGGKFHHPLLHRGQVTFGGELLPSSARQRCCRICPAASTRGSSS